MNEEAVFVLADVAGAADPIGSEDVKPLACRGCLAVSRPLRPLQRATAALYEELVGIPVRQADIYPKFVCSYCHALLLKFNAFRVKCRSAQSTFLDLHSAGITITRDLLQSGITGGPFPNLKETWPQLLYVDSATQNMRLQTMNCGEQPVVSYVGGAQEKPYIHEVPLTDITGPIKEEQLDHIADPENLFNNLLCNQNKRPTSPFPYSVEDSYATPVANSTDAVNDNHWQDSDNFGQDSDMPDCMLDSKRDIYKNDTEKNVEVENPIPKIAENKRYTEVYLIKNVKDINATLDTFKSWVKAEKCYVNKKKAKTDKSCASNASTSAGTTDDGQIENEKGSCNDDDVELVAEATHVVNVDTDSEDNCLDHITVIKTKKRKKKKLQGKALKDKKESNSRCTLREVKRRVKKIKAAKAKEPKPKKVKKSKLIRYLEEKRRKFEKKCNVKTVQLSKEDQIKQMEARKESKKYKEADFKCELCYRIFISKLTLDNHMAKHELSHGDYICDVCNLRYTTQSKMNLHVHRAHLYDYICNDCGEITKSSGKAGFHSKWHKGVKYSCKICDKSFNYPNTLSSHMHLSHGGTVECSLCNEMFVGKHGLSSHMVLSHKDAVGAVCPDCNTQFHNESALQRHRSVGCDVTRSTCVVCGEGFTTGQLLEEHMTEQHKQIYKCDQCGKHCETLKKYKIHVTNHHIGKQLLHKNKGKRKWKKKQKGNQFICEICGASTSSKAGFVIHIRAHTGEKPFECAHCSTRFTSKFVLKKHILLKHTPDQSLLAAQLPQYACPLCDRQFSMKANRNRHVEAVHEKQRPFSCDSCGKTYTQKVALQSHINTKHLGMPWPKRIRK